MSGGSRIVSEAQTLVAPVVEAFGLELVDVEYKKEGSAWFLRFFIDKPGGVGIEDCQTVSRAIDPLLDQKMDIPGHYNLEVSSPGLERPFKTDRDFLRNLGNEVEVALFEAREGKKKFEGILKDFQDGVIALDLPDGTRLDLKKEETSRVRKTVRIG